MLFHWRRYLSIYQKKNIDFQKIGKFKHRRQCGCSGASPRAIGGLAFAQAVQPHAARHGDRQTVDARRHVNAQAHLQNKEEEEEKEEAEQEEERRHYRA